MADTEKLIKIIFEAVDDTTATIGKIGGSIKKLDSGITDIAEPFAKMGDSILTVDKYLAALAVGGMAYSTAKAIDLESAVVGLDKVLSDQEKSSLPDLVSRMGEFGDAFGFTAAEAVASAGEFRKASFELEDAAHLAELSAKLVVGAGEANFRMGESTATLTALLKGFKVEQEDIVVTSTHMADVLNKLADEYATTVGELSNGLTILAPIADGLGYSFDEMAGLMIPVVEIFGSGAESANGLKTSLLSLADPTKEVRSALEAYGIALEDANGEQKNVKQILNDLLPVYQGLDKAQQTQLASMIAGKDQAAKFTALLNGMDTALKATTISATEAGGSLEKEVARGLATAEVQVKRFTASFVNLAAAIGSKFLDSTTGIIKGATDIQIALRKIVEGDGFKAVFDFVNESGKELEALLSDIAENLPEAFDGIDFSGILESFSELKDNILSTFDLDLSTTEGLTQAIQTVVNVIDLLIKTSSGIYDAFKPYIQGVLDAANNTDKLNENNARAVGELLGIAKAITSLGGILGSFVTVMLKAGNDIESTFNVVSNAIKTIVNGIQAQFDFVVGILIFIVQKFANAANTIAQLSPFEGFQKSTEEFKKSIDELSAANIYSLKQNITETIDSASKTIDSFGAKVKETKKEIEKPVKIGFDFSGDEAERKNKEWLEKIEGFRKELEDKPLKVNTEIETKDLSTQIEDIDSKISDLTGKKNEIDLQLKEYNSQGATAPDGLVKEVIALDESIKSLTEQKNVIQLQLESEESYDQVKAVKDEIDSITEEERIVRLQTDVNEGRGLGEIVDELTRLEDGSYKIELKSELQGIDDVEKKIDEVTKDKKFLLQVETKQMEEETKRIVKQIETSSKTIQKQLEYKFKLDVKQAEINLEKITKAYDSTKGIIESVTKANSDLFASFSTEFDQQTLWQFQDQLEQNLEIQREQADQQILLNEQLIRELELKNQLREKFLNSDEAILKMTVDKGLEPDLEALLRALIPRLQLWGTENDISLIIEAS